MISIIDNGKGQEISKILRSAKILKNDIPKKGGIIISDGEINKKNQELCANVLDKFNGPILGIGMGYLFIVALAGGEIVEKKGKKRNLKLKITNSCPLTTDMKICSVVKTSSHEVKSIPEFFRPVAKSQESVYEIIEDISNPIFGIHADPSLGGDGIKILRNFEKFIELWEKYHK